MSEKIPPIPTDEDNNWQTVPEQELEAETFEGANGNKFTRKELENTYVVGVGSADIQLLNDRAQLRKELGIVGVPENKDDAPARVANGGFLTVVARDKLKAGLENDSPLVSDVLPDETEGIAEVNEVDKGAERTKERKGSLGARWKVLVVSGLVVVAGFFGAMRKEQAPGYDSGKSAVGTSSAEMKEEVYLNDESGYVEREDSPEGKVLVERSEDKRTDKNPAFPGAVGGENVLAGKTNEEARVIIGDISEQPAVIAFLMKNGAFTQEELGGVGDVKNIATLEQRLDLGGDLFESGRKSELENILKDKIKDAKITTEVSVSNGTMLGIEHLIEDGVRKESTPVQQKLSSERAGVKVEINGHAFIYLNECGNLLFVTPDEDLPVRDDPDPGGGSGDTTTPKEADPKNEEYSINNNKEKSYNPIYSGSEDQGSSDTGLEGSNQGVSDTRIEDVTDAGLGQKPHEDPTHNPDEKGNELTGRP
jgi:hypothetical protein